MSDNRISTNKMYLHGHHVGDLHENYIALREDFEFTLNDLQTIVALVVLKNDR